LLLCSSCLPLGVPNCLAIIIINYKPAIKPFSGAVAGKEEDFCEGSFRMHILYFVLNFDLLYFYLHSFYQKPKKISFLLVVIFTYLALSCFLSMVGFFETKSFWQGGFTEE
jgi:hypothetical protein